MGNLLAIETQIKLFFYEKKGGALGFDIFKE